MKKKISKIKLEKPNEKRKQNTEICHQDTNTRQDKGHSLKAILSKNENHEKQTPNKIF